MRYSILLIVCGCLLTGCGQDTADEPEISRIEAVADDYLRAMLLYYPETATYYSLPGMSHADLFENSPEAQAAWHVKVDGWLAELDEIGAPMDVGSRDWVTYGILYEELAASVGARVCRSELWAASTATAWHTHLPFVFDLQPVGSPEARAEALQRLGEVAGYIDLEITNLRMGLDFGFSAPRPTVEKVSGEIRALLADDNPFLGVASRDDDAEFAVAVQTIFDEQIAPAIERFASYIETDYLPNAREELALTFNPDGDECYTALVRSFTTISPSAASIHETGLEQIVGIRAEMQTVIDQHYGGGEIEPFLIRLNVDPEFTFDSEAEIVDISTNSLDRARGVMPELFGLLPKADVIVRAYPPHRASGTGEYWSSSEDGTRPGTFFIPTSNPEQRSRANMQSFLYHETYPGHHLQGAIALELGDRVHPIARYLWNSGYGEGWGLYSERLMDEVGLYNTPLDRMGMLSDQGARAARLVIDTGLHTKGWTRQQAVDYMQANMAWSPSDVQSEIDRYIAWPGQANAYMLGMLEFMRLRALAEEAFGNEFDIRQFHDRVLENGSVTLPMLEEMVLAWIAGRLPVVAVAAPDPRVVAIHEQSVFADMHAHPSRFHRENVETILPQEIEVYRRSNVDLVVANISTDMAYDGEYTNRDGSFIEKGRYKPAPGEVYALSADRLARLNKTIELGYAVHADTPTAVLEARESNEVAILPALEGSDALEGDINNLYEMHANGLRLVQLIHFRNNELGHTQTWPYSPGGLTDFGRLVVQEANRLGLVIDVAHANEQTISEVLQLSKHPVIFSHGGVREFTNHDRAVTDDQIRAISAKGGIIGIWPHGRHLQDVAEMVDYMEHVIKIGGVDHVGIGSDLRGISTYVKGFDETANFHAIAAEFLVRGYSDEDVGKIMGGNFFRLWQTVSD